MSRRTILKVRGYMIRMFVSYFSFVIDGNAVHIFQECPNFKLYNLQDKPSSFNVQNGGWVVYEKPNYMVLSIMSIIFSKQIFYD